VQSEPVSPELVLIDPSLRERVLAVDPPVNGHRGRRVESEVAGTPDNGVSAIPTPTVLYSYGRVWLVVAGLAGAGVALVAVFGLGSVFAHSTHRLPPVQSAKPNVVPTGQTTTTHPARAGGKTTEQHKQAHTLTRPAGTVAPGSDVAPAAAPRAAPKPATPPRASPVRKAVPARKVVPVPKAPTAKKAVLAPTATDTTRRRMQRFAWAPASGATSYEVAIYEGGRRVFVARTKTAAVDIPVSGQARGSPESLEPGTYQWYVWPIRQGHRARVAIVRSRLVVPAQ
jgi:hypothetical protein